MLFSVRLGTDKSRTVIGLYGFFMAYKLLYSSSVTGSHHSFELFNPEHIRTCEALQYLCGDLGVALVDISECSAKIVFIGS